MYSSNGPSSKAKSARASSLAKTDGVCSNSDRASPDSRATGTKGGKRRQRSPPRLSESLTRSGSSDASGWTSMDEEQRKQNGRPVTWVGGGGLDIKWLSTLGVPRLRAIFLDVFGHHTASNNGAWLRRKLAEPAEGGRGRAVQIRARDASAAIWTTGRVKGVSKAEVSAIVAERQAERRSSNDRSASNDRSGRSTRANGNTSFSSGSLTPSRPAAPQAVPMAARITRLFAEELPSEKKTYFTRASEPTVRDCSLFGIPTYQQGLQRLVMKRNDLRHKHAMRGLAVELLWQDDGQWWPATVTQVDSCSVNVLYENGDSEQLATSEVLRDGLLSLGWVQPEPWMPADSASCPSSEVASAAGSATDEARYLASSQEPDEELQSLLSYEEVCQNAVPDLKDDLEILEPPSKKPKLDIPQLDLLSSPPFCPILSALDSTMSTPSALLPPPPVQANTPMDAATCDWADNLLATAHRPTPTARFDSKFGPGSCFNSANEAKPSPVAFRKGNPASSVFVSPPGRVVASVIKGPNPSRLGFTSPPGGVAVVNLKSNPSASPATASAKHPHSQGSFVQPQGQGTPSQRQASFVQPQKVQGVSAQPHKVRSIPMQPLKAQSDPASLSLGLQSPSVRGSMPSNQGIGRQPYAQGRSAQPLSYDVASERIKFSNVQPTLIVAGPQNMKHMCTVTTGMPDSSSTVSAKSVSQPAFAHANSTFRGMMRPEKLSGDAASFAPAAGAVAPQGCAAKPVVQLPNGVIDMSHGGGHMPSSKPTFMDSVTAFTEGFTLTHCTENEGLSDWVLSDHSSACAVDAYEITQYESGLTSSDLSEDASELMWKVSDDMLVDGIFQ